MSVEKGDSFYTHFTGKNCSSWAFHFQLLVEGKGDLWGHIDGSLPPPNQEKDKEKYLAWKIKDSRIMAWIIGSVDD